MPASRLTTALETGAVSLPPAGRVAVYGPRAGADLSALSKDRVHIIQGFKPDHDAFAAQGFDVGLAASGDYAAALVFLPRSKVQARALIAEAAAHGTVIVDGQKTDGVESILRDIRKRADVGDVISKAHGKIFAFMGGDFTDWRADPAGQSITGGFTTAPGVFSADGIDPGSAALAAALPARLTGRIADLGAGWGYLAREILTRGDVAELHLIEASHAALECARANVTDPRARFHWADATRFTPETPFDAVITNPPFHTSRAADPAIGRAFIAAAARMLKPPGKLWLVANRHLPYEAEAALHFLDVQEAAGDKRFKILLAAKPRRSRR